MRAPNAFADVIGAFTTTIIIQSVAALRVLIDPNPTLGIERFIWFVLTLLAMVPPAYAVQSTRLEWTMTVAKYGGPGQAVQNAWILACLLASTTLVSTIFTGLALATLTSASVALTIVGGFVPELVVLWLLAAIPWPNIPTKTNSRYGSHMGNANL